MLHIMIISIPHLFPYLYAFTAPSPPKITDNLGLQQSASGLTFVIHVICTGGSCMLLVFAEMCGGFVVWNMFYSAWAVANRFVTTLTRASFKPITPESESWHLASVLLLWERIQAAVFLCSSATGVDAFLLIVPAEWKKGEE